MPSPLRVCAVKVSDEMVRNSMALGASDRTPQIFLSRMKVIVYTSKHAHTHTHTFLHLSGTFATRRISTLVCQSFLLRTKFKIFCSLSQSLRTASRMLAHLLIRSSCTMKPAGAFDSVRCLLLLPVAKKGVANARAPFVLSLCAGQSWQRQSTQSDICVYS